jgi:hypothetical protein
MFRSGKLAMYDERAHNPDALGMDYIDYGLSILSPKCDCR